MNLNGKKIFKQNQTYISDEERKKCRKVAHAFAELYRHEDLLVLDAGKYGFIKLQYYKVPFGFEDAIIFTDSKELFKDLWKEWLYTQLLDWAKNTPIMELDYKEIFKCMPPQKQKELIKKKSYLKKKLKITEK